MKVLLVRSPRYYWPFINEADNYLLPQGLACLAAVVRERGHQVKVYDCMPMHIGWKTLGNIIRQEEPDVVGVGDSETVYCYEAARVLQMAKEINPRIVTVAGGAHFSNLIEQSLREFAIDFIVRGEGEVTFCELIDALEDGCKDFSQIPGLAYMEDGQMIRTPPRPLKKNLDDFPMPAYDLMPMSEYGKAKLLFDPGGITIHHSRGCADACDFCVWWVQMSQEVWKNGEVRYLPRWRTKSVEYAVDEVELLIRKYNKRGFVYVDDSWNMSAKWGNDFAEEVLRRGLKFNWFAFMRADCMLRDEKQGVLEKLVRAGLRHVCIGVERASSTQMSALNKNFYNTDLVAECFALLKSKYPQVFRQGTFIVGVRDETEESMLQLLEYAKKLDLDFPAFHPMTPVPGTKLWDEARENGWIEVEDFSFYDWYTPVMSSKYLSREEIEKLMAMLQKKYARLSWLLRGLCSRHRYKRNMYLWFLLVISRVAFYQLQQNLSINTKDWQSLVKPYFYDS